MGSTLETYLNVPETAKSTPNGCDSLIDIYHLRPFANSVARQDPYTGAKRKLRKSYKNQIADLPGRNTVPPPNSTKWNLVNISLEAQATDAASNYAKALDIPDTMLFGVNIVPGPLQNFDSSLLGLPYTPNADPAPSNPPNDERKDKRKRREASIQMEKRRKF